MTAEIQPAETLASSARPKLGPIFLTVFVVLVFVIIDPLCDALVKGERHLTAFSAEVAWISGLLLACLFIGRHGATTFIYFQF